jgi:hypothetical protein
LRNIFQIKNYEVCDVNEAMLTIVITSLLGSTLQLQYIQYIYNIHPRVNLRTKGFIFIYNLFILENAAEKLNHVK